MTELESNFKYLRISNFNRVSGTPSNFVMDLSNETNLHNATSVWIDAVTVPNVFYNIDTHNNRLDFRAINLGGAPNVVTFITVPSGFYTIIELLTAIKTAMDTAMIPVTGTVDFTHDDITNLVSFTTTGLDSLEIFIYNSTTGESTMSPFIGNLTTLSVAPTGTFSGMPTLSGESMIYLHSKDINLGNTVISTFNTSAPNSNRNVSAFCSIPVKVPFLANIHYKSKGSPTDNIVIEGTKDLCNCNIKLRARDGRILTLGENHELTIVLKVFY
jgi:hypothetical protein